MGENGASQRSFGRPTLAIALGVLCCAETLLIAQTPPVVTEYVVGLFSEGANPNAPRAAPAQVLAVPASSVTCDSDPPPVAAGRIAPLLVNPTGLTWDDPENTGRACVVNLPAFFSAGPLGMWVVAVKAMSAAGSSPYSNAVAFIRGTLAIRSPERLSRPRR
jgi:hypothetical protein